MQKTDEWSIDSDFTNNSEPENNVNENNQDNEDNKTDSSDNDDVSVLSDDQEDDYFLELNTEKTVFVITQDNIPLLYVNTIEHAHSIMWALARNYRTHWFNNYNTYIREDFSQNKIEITGNYRYLLIFYERLLSTFEVHPVHEIFREI